MVNPFRCKILHKKASLAVLSDERNAGLFDAAEQRGDRGPRAVDAGGRGAQTTVHNGARGRPGAVHRRPTASGSCSSPTTTTAAPASSSAGPWTTDEWRQGDARAVDEPYIVQERVPIPSEPYPSLVDGAVQILDRMLDTAPFVVHGEYMDGCLTRLSTAALLNVTAGGGSTVPTFVVEKR